MKKFLLLSFSTLFICLFARAQGDSKFKSDSSECYINISLFSEHFEQNNYNDAIELWRWVFAHCPAVAKHMYLDGATLFEKKIAEEKNPEMKLKFQDTLMLIYDQRIKYFNEEGFVLGKKGLSMYDLSPDKKETINTILKRSVEIEGPKSSPDVLFKYFQVNIELFGQKKMSKETVIDVYDDVLALFATQRTGSDSATYNKSRVGVETLFSAQISCEDLITIFSPQLKAAPDDLILLKKIVRLFNKRACIDASVYLEAAENLYKFEPDAEAATRLAQIYVAKGLFGKATSYFNEAFELESDNVKKSILLLELSDHYSINLKNYPQARTYAQRAASLRPNWGRPWIAIGDIYLSGSATCSDEFNGASVYWAATDKYLKAQIVDAAMTEEATRKIERNSKYYPKQEAILVHGMKAGDTYKVKCWINETTTICVK